ncbi:Zinc transport protein ZntB [Rhynchospora pubera]|uniref:Zinc transport protein ZntB n=1 Tax=Rhynchospora pubera TaxID=906938 RepID=A0AAV8C1I7_9POAL|nr:Zinc transport protein ZntB [Rhynchospora pubera]
MSDTDNQNSGSSKFTKHEHSKFSLSRDGPPVSDLWNDGLICAFEYVRGNHRKPNAHQLYPTRMSKPVNHTLSRSNGNNAPDTDEPIKSKPVFDRKWVPIGWSRISELVQKVQADNSWTEQQMDLSEEEDDYTVADVAAPYWERPVGPTWWCHVVAGHPSVETWLGNAQWLHPAIRTALRDESRLISDRMKYLLYEVPVRVAGGLLFELLGQSVGDPLHEEEDIPIVIRCWQAQNFLVSAMHVKGTTNNLNVLGVTEVLELLLAGGSQAPRSVHEVIAHLTCRLSRWDDRLFRKYVFGEADEIELKFVNRRNYEDLNLLSIILNQEIKRLATQVIRVKWSLHAREEIIFELIQHLRGNVTRYILEDIKKSTRVMLEEQEAVRGRLFTIQDVMQSTVRAWLQDRSLRVTHNLGIFGGCGLVLSIFTGLFGINVDGIPGAENTPYAFGLFTGLLFVLGAMLIGIGMLYLGLQNPISEEKVKVRKLELQQLVSMFQHDAEHHAKVREGVTRHGGAPNSSGNLSDADYILIH